MASESKPAGSARRSTYVALSLASALVASAGTALLIGGLDAPEAPPPATARPVDVGEDDTDAVKWAAHWPLQYDGYRYAASPTSTRFGDRGGSEALPAEKLERDPWLRRLYSGYPFAPDAPAGRGHTHMLTDEEASKGLSAPQSSGCLHCHASVMPLYRSLGDGDPMIGFSRSYTSSYADLSQKLQASGHAHPVGCVDCHDPESMALRVTRPAFLRAIQALASSQAPLPALPSIAVWRKGERERGYDPNRDASHVELRSLVCGQCHAEYFCANKIQLTIPWSKGLRMEDLEEVWDQTELSDGLPFYDFIHEETGARMLKAQHPQLELWSRGVHARSGVSCADCHMPYAREGAGKVTDHALGSPLGNVSRACQTCHRFTEAELTARAQEIQSRNHDLLERAGQALEQLIGAMSVARSQGVSEGAMATARALQRRAQWRLDFVAAENSNGFHAPQEAARILAEAIDFARQGLAFALMMPRPPPETDEGKPAPEVASGTR